MYTVTTHSAEETEAVGVQLGKHLRSFYTDERFFVAMYGDLGAGKTVFVRGLTSVFSQGSRVKSPTYTIVNEYRRGEVPLFHFDLYRISDTDELDGIGFDDYVREGNCIAEWCEKIGDLLPEGAVKVKLEKHGEEERLITIEGITFSEDET